MASKRALQNISNAAPAERGRGGKKTMEPKAAMPKAIRSVREKCDTWMRMCSCILYDTLLIDMSSYVESQIDFQICIDLRTAFA